VNSTKKTLFWIIVLIMLSGTFYFFDQKVEDNQRIKEASLELFPFSVVDVTEFWINNKKENHQLQLSRGQDGWHLIQPLSAKGDDEAIEKLLVNIVKARKDAILFTTPDPGKLKELGLDAPELEMGLRAAGEEITILFGDKGPTHNVAYIKFKQSPDVYRVHSDVKKEASKDTYALRDKTVLDIEPVKLRRFEVEQKGKDRVVIEHEKGKWNTLEPNAGKASMEKVLESLYEIDNAQIKAFVDEEPTDLASYGLAAPKLKLTIFEGEQSEGEQALPQILSIGDKDRSRRGYFAMSNQADNVFVIEENLYNAILLNRDKWSE